MVDRFFSAYGMSENPFHVSPNPQYLYMSSATRSALSELIYGIQTQRGFILLTGEAGTGKTTLIHHLLGWLQQRCIPTAYVFNSHLGAQDLIEFILHEFGIPSPVDNKGDSLVALNKWLIERHRVGETPVLILDEAQGLSISVLEEIRLLLNLEVPQGKLLQIVLVGQPELEEKLKRRDLRQLRQRITLRCRLNRLSLEETGNYIASRLKTAGSTGGELFPPATVEAIYRCSSGIPRVVNLLCEHALIGAYAEELPVVPPQIVAEVARDFEFDTAPLAVALDGFNGSFTNSLRKRATIAAFEEHSPVISGPDSRAAKMFAAASAAAPSPMLVRPSRASAGAAAAAAPAMAPEAILEALPSEPVPVSPSVIAEESVAARADVLPVAVSPSVVTPMAPDALAAPVGYSTETHSPVVATPVIRSEPFVWRRKRTKSPSTLPKIPKMNFHLGAIPRPRAISVNFKSVSNAIASADVTIDRAWRRFSSKMRDVLGPAFRWMQKPMPSVPLRKQRPS